ncbi:MAG: dephospho-CoA kinase [Eubacteriales bacterium]|nr:dephospho-CoA kinase [Eubacteriales bacterium]
MKVIGLTGGIASGKSTASKYLQELGAQVWDADKAARKVVRPGSAGAKAVAQAFGQEYFNAKGELDRAALGRAVFADEAKRVQLDGILHPLIAADAKKTLARWEKAGVAVAVVDAPLLLECGMEELTDEVWVVSCGSDEQLRRLVERDRLTFDEARSRMKAQMDDAERRRRAQRVIDTSAAAEDTRRALRALYEELTEE